MSFLFVHHVQFHNTSRVQSWQCCLEILCCFWYLSHCGNNVVDQMTVFLLLKAVGSLCDVVQFPKPVHPWIKQPPASVQERGGRMQ